MRGLRRERLAREGRNLARSLPRLKSIDAKPAAAVTQAVTPMLRESGLAPADCQRTSYEVVGAPDRRVVHVYTASLPAADATLRPLSLVATEQGGRLLHVRRMHAR